MVNTNIRDRAIPGSTNRAVIHRLRFVLTGKIASFILGIDVVSVSRRERGWHPADLPVFLPGNGFSLWRYREKRG